MARGISARRHAQAVFQIALEKNELERWQRDLDSIVGMVESPELAALLENPKLRFSEKARILRDILTDISPLAMKLTLFLVAKNRLRILSDLVTEYRRLVDAHYGREHAEVVTAIPLSDEEKERLKTRLVVATGK